METNAGEYLYCLHCKLINLCNRTERDTDIFFNLPYKIY